MYPTGYTSPETARTQARTQSPDWIESDQVSQALDPKSLPQDPDHKLIAWGWATAILAWPVGVILGVVLLGKGRTDKGLPITLVAAAIGIIAIVATVTLSAVGAATEPTYYYVPTQ